METEVESLMQNDWMVLHSAHSIVARPGKGGAWFPTEEAALHIVQQLADKGYKNVRVVRGR